MRTGTSFSGFHFDTLYDVVLHVEEQRTDAQRRLQLAKRSLHNGERGKRGFEDNVLKYDTAYKIWDNVWAWLHELVEEEEAKKRFEEVLLPAWNRGEF